jgi:5-formyltetrahydrofolate cyclo-ligase
VTVRHGDEDESPGSPPCLMHELGPDGNSVVDPAQVREVERWRSAERKRLIAARLALSALYRAARAEAIANELDPLIVPLPEAIISVYWPIRGEPDLRPWMRAQWDRGVRIALPVARTLHQPLEFREWRPEGPLARGLWKIPYPEDGAEVTPTVMLAPVVGFDAACYRLGYGGGFFDRTLARRTDRPLLIGIGYPEAFIPTIFPQPHDVPMTRIVTGESHLRGA